MNPILLAIIVLVVLGLAGGIILVLASKFMAVEEDPRIAEVTEALAGANCGGCGYAGCADYAEAIVTKGAPTSKCAPGGEKSVDAIHRILGLEEIDLVPQKACVGCNGGENCEKRYEYLGIASCAAAASLAGGPSACANGCLGLGDCVKACKFDAIHVVNGLAVVDREKCTGCSACMAACPRGVIKMKVTEAKPAALCSNKNKGPAVSKICKAGCIGCGICEKNCPNGAIKLENNLPVIDEALCTGCGTCAVKCPKGVFAWPDGMTAKAKEAEAEAKAKAEEKARAAKAKAEAAEKAKAEASGKEAEE